MRLVQLLLAFVPFAGGLAARADTITDFRASGTTVGAAFQLSGDVFIDISDGTFSSIDLTVGDPYDLQFTFLSRTQYYPGAIEFDVDTLPLFDNHIEASLITETLVDYVGGQFGANIYFADGRSDYFLDGTLTPVATDTPEPSTLALLGTGAIGLMAAFRLRLTHVE